MEDSAITLKVRSMIDQVTSEQRNVGEIERWASALGGGTLIFYGLKQRSWSGVALALLGGALAYRGVTGHCPVYRQLGVNTFETEGGGAEAERGTEGKEEGPGGLAESARAEKSIRIPDKGAEELYRFWHQVENLPRIMNHIESVREKSNNHSHWTAKATGGTELEWEAEIIDAVQNERITWRAIEEGEANNVLSVRFEKAADGAGTQVHLTMEYHPSQSLLGAAFAKLFGEPGRVVEEALARFKEAIDASDTASQAA